MNHYLQDPLVLNNKTLADLMAELFVLPCGVSIAVDPDCKVIRHNRTAAAFLRIREGDNFSMTADEPPKVRTFDVHGRELTPEQLTLQKAMAQNSQNKQIVELEWPDGVRKVAVWNSKPIVNPQGEVIGGVSISEDITFHVMEERRTRHEQDYLRKELERLDRLGHVSHLAAGISHEVRNPLTTVKGFLQIMRVKQRYEDDRSIIDMLLEELNRANEIISDYLSLAQVHERQLTTGNLLEVIERLSPLIENDAFLARKKLIIRQTAVCDILMDSKEIKQLILNLVRNAMDATPAGGHIYIETFETADTVGFTVLDEGTGIPKEVVDRLGTPFVTTKPGGTGVGLAICYDIVRRHNAVIDVGTSAKGTVFKIEFPKPC
ncbi:signal transduction histidine kinase [Paenibacillus phyllosphaerae]|uniref:histidine kinase n=1 Tax=Paenibacillus phyllosphaerae TaxID=274593 RepID=A0A7W5B169_9BACL|nr:ATP-binding protein [Paenibacillus phyllosphaerae]MBB3112503.1 signal transduction histidine kinase [Paenibacillus phyllosphaerae]